MHDELDEQPLSDQLTANEAQASALHLARTEGVPVVFVHDCYARVHEVRPSA